MYFSHLIASLGECGLSWAGRGIWRCVHDQYSRVLGENSGGPDEELDRRGRITALVIGHFHALRRGGESTKDARGFRCSDEIG